MGRKSVWFRCPGGRRVAGLQHGGGGGGGGGGVADANPTQASAHSRGHGQSECQCKGKWTARWVKNKGNETTNARTSIGSGMKVKASSHELGERGGAQRANGGASGRMAEVEVSFKASEWKSQNGPVTENVYWATSCKVTAAEYNCELNPERDAKCPILVIGVLLLLSAWGSPAGERVEQPP